MQAKYSYDAWGNCAVTDSTNSHLANYNPIRYRGYYWDSETGWYFLNARYYSPEWRRFISPDDTAYLNPENANGLNLYCYCNNDPENYADPSGHFPITTILLTAFTCGLIAASTNAIGQVVFDGATLGTMEWERVVIAGASGFLAGLIPGTGFASLAAQALVSSVVDNGISAIWLGDNFSIFNVIKDASITFFAGAAIKGLTHLTSKFTSNQFIKGGNYSQFQRYFRQQGLNLSRSEAHRMMNQYIFYKEASDEVIKTSLDFLLSFVVYPY